MALTKTKIAVGATVVLLLAAVVTILLMLKSTAGHDLAGRETSPGGAPIPAAPVDLTAIYTTPASYFDQITAFPAWKTVPRGEQVFGNVKFQNHILYGEDVLDWYTIRGQAVAGPTGPNFQLAWHGDNSPGAPVQPVRFCMTAVKNPQPLVEVRSLDLYSSKSRSAACILAFSTTLAKAAK